MKRLFTIIVSLTTMTTMLWGTDIHVYPLVSKTLPGMNTARMSHVCFATESGDIVVVGGHTTGFYPTATAERLHDGSWESITIGTAHDVAAIAMMSDGKVMVAGGLASSGGVGRISACNIYDPATNSFSSTGSMTYNHALTSAVATGNGNDVLVAGNWYASDNGAQLWNEGSFSKISGLGTEFNQPHMVSDGQGNVYIFCSHNNYGGKITPTPIYKVDTKSKTISTVTNEMLSGYVIDPASAGVPFASSMTSDGKYLFVGAKNGGNDLLAFDPATESCEKLTSITLPTTITGSEYALIKNVLVNNKRKEAYIAATINSSGKRCLIVYNYQLEDGTMSVFYGNNISDMPYWGFSWAINPINNEIVITGGTIGNSNYNAQSFALSIKPFDPMYSCPDGNHPHLIDLGLPSGTKWACCNIGATVPEGYGGRYAWGEITERDEAYSSTNYIHYISPGIYQNIGSDISGTQYDTATSLWGADWQMPTEAQAQELIDNCNRESIKVNETNCYKFTAPNGNFIILPLAGFHCPAFGNNAHTESEGNYWTSTISTSGPTTGVNGDAARRLWPQSGTINDSWRYNGQSVRAVSAPATKPITSTDILITVASATYTGAPQTPAVTVTDGSTTLTEDTDYTLTYANNTDAGKGQVTVTGMGKYTGEITIPFVISPADIGTATAAIDLVVPANLGAMDGTGGPTDLAPFLDSYLQNSPNPAYIKLTLEGGARYTISKPIETLTAIQILGNDAGSPAVIDASSMTGDFLTINKNTVSGTPNEKGFYTNIYNVELKNIEIQYLSGALFNANGQKYVIPQLTIENVNVRLLGSEAINLTGSALEKLILSKSTLSAAKATLYKAGAAPETAGSGNPAITASYNTFWGVGKLDGITDYNKQVSVDFNHNIVIDYDGFVADLNADPAYLLAQYNAFQKPKTSKVDGQLVVEFEDVSDAEDAKGAAGSIKGALVMANGVDGIDEGDFSLGGCPQKEAKIGDPRWLNASLLSKLISPESLDDDNDLAKAINQGVQEGFVKFQLAENRRYTVKQTIVADKGLVIRGKNVVIDVEHADALVLMGKTPTGGFMPKSSTEAAAPALNRAAGVEYTDYYKFDELTLSGLKVNGLKNSIIYDNNVKYCVIDLTIDNCVMQLETEAVKYEALIAFQAGGVNNLTIKNSTFYGNNEVAKYFVRYNNSARIDRFGFDKADDTWSFTYENNTFYGLLKSDGQWGNYSGIVGKNAQGIVTVKNNIWYNCDAQTMRRMLGSKNFSQFSKASLMENNTFFVGGAAADQGNYGNGSDLTGEPGFKRPAEGDFTLSAYSEQFDKKTGDPRWYADGGHYNPVTAIEVVEAGKTAHDGDWYTLQGTRVSKPAKGLYIHNGKKVVIK